MFGLLAVLALVLLSGCATINVHATVTADGTIEEYRFQINTSSTVYGFLNEAAKDEGYDSLREQLLADIDENATGEVTYDEEFDGDDVSITVTILEFEPPADSSFSITEEDGMLVYEDLTFANETTQMTEEQRSFLSGLVVHYYLEMPGDITDSNADEVNGNIAEWHETGADALVNNRIYAKSEIPGPLSVNMPGFGFVIAITALLLTGLLARRG